MAISLLIRRPDQTEARQVFEGTKVTIGSAPHCDLTIEEQDIDAEQALLVARVETVELFEIGAHAKVLVNGRPARHAYLRSGDEIWVGATLLKLAGEAGEGVSFTEIASTVRAEMPVQEEAPAHPETAAPQRFALLNEVRRLINSIGSDEDIFESILDTVFSSVPIRRGFIAITPRDGSLQVKAHRSCERAQAGSGPIQVSRTLVNKVIEGGRAVLTADAETDPDFSTARSVHALKIRAAVCVPLTVDDTVIGLLYGDNRERPASLTTEHLAILSALASVAAVAVEKFRLLGEYNAKLRLEQSLAIARTIQRAFLPGESPATDWLDVWGRSESCDETGGDYFDFLHLAEGRFAVVVADVTGHGVGPALLMASVRAALRALVEHEPSPERLVARLNELVRNDVRDGRFITLFLGSFDPAAMKFRHVGAGHTPPIFYRRRDRSTHLVPSRGPPLGILPDVIFRAGTDLPLASGDVLLFTTDGLIEAQNEKGEHFGFPRLRAVLSEHASESACDLALAVHGAVERFRGSVPLRDDTTLVAVKVR